MCSAAQVLVTGASGFVGKYLLHQFVDRQIPALGVVRSETRAAELRELFGQFGDTVKLRVIPEDSSVENWQQLFTGIQTVVHLGARAHITDREGSTARQAYWKTNVEWSRVLAEASRASQVRQFIYVSSIKALGDFTFPGHPFTTTSEPHPQDDYGRSKLVAEREIASCLTGSATKLFILRTPLIYGPGVKANFLSLIRAAEHQLPLPLRSVHNRRSLLFVGNLTDLIATIITANSTPGTYLVSDTVPLSTPELFSVLAKELGVRCNLLPFPRQLLALGLRLVGKAAIAEKLLGDLELDTSDTCNQLHWSPPIDVKTGLRITASWYKNRVGHQTVGVA